MKSKKLQIFVSSTYLDLQDERQAAVASILKSGHIPAGMELFTAGDESQWETIRRWIEESDIYMLILGGRYGSLHPDTGIGYTEMEYDYAIEQDKPFFAVVITEPALELKVKARGREVLELSHPDKLSKFRTKVLSKISSFYSDSKDIKLAVLETIPALERKYSPSGWISGKEFIDTKPLVDEIARLTMDAGISRKENEKLLAEITRLKSKDNDGDLNELSEVIKAIEVDITPYHKDLGDMPPKVSLLKILLHSADELATGITNQSNVSDWEGYLYYHVCPKLKIHEIVDDEKVTGMLWRRFTLTTKGKRFLAFMQKLTINSQKNTEKFPD